MRTGKLSISRGHEIGAIAPAPRLALVPRAEPETRAAPVREPAAPASPEYQLVHDRLTALERLTRLLEQGALSEAEFAAEKATILSLPADELVLHEAAHVSAEPPRLPRGPSLLGRLLSWKVLPVGVAAGFALSFAAQPRQTIGFFDELLRLFGV